MGLIEITKEAASKPFDRSNDILVGTVIVMASIFIVPIFTLYGYFMEVVKSIARDGEVPQPGNYLELTFNGLKLYLILLPVTALGLVTYLPLWMGLLDSLALNAVAGLGYLVTGYFGFAIALTYMVERDWRKAYSVESIRMTLNLKYVKYLLAFFVVYYGMAAVASIVMLLSFITIVGWLVVIPAASFYLMVFGAILMGRIYEELEESR